LLSYIIGGVVSAFLLLAKKAGRKTEIPFGIFIVPAMIITMLFGQQIINWYLSAL
jgi:leader peptidase (prepilin peptidase)/N-methyltransferase